MIKRQALLTDLQSLLRVVEADLLARSEDAELPEVNGWLRAEYDAAKVAGRTAQTFKSWVDDFITQVAAAWVLSCVFVRYLEDNALLDPPRIAGPAHAVGGGQSRLKRARDEYDHWVQGNRGMTDRDYLLGVLTALAEMPAAGEVFGQHNPLMALPNWLSGDAASAMLAFFQKVDADTGQITHDFTDPSGDTRFLGDLYQDLSEAARKKYALLQTPDFVEAFILDRTLEPALDECGLATAPHFGSACAAVGRRAGGEGPSGFRMIDPACGSGHFLLGAFARILDRWQRKEPGTKVRVLVQRALDSIHGVDVNPYAVAIARFRLLLAALAACDCKKLKDAPNFEIHLACGDSLWHAPLRGQTGKASRGQRELPEFSPEAASETQQHTYYAEDAARLERILAEGQYHCVVANPPYIVPKDRALNQDYRARYSSCHMKYSLAVPFMERIFRLAIPAAGYTGQITANSFMKREFGKKLIEEFLPTVDLTHVVDTSGAYIPGHGTPTTILFGRNRPPVAATIRTVMGIKGEPSTPENPAQGHVWTAIVDQIDRPGSESDFVSAGDSERERFGSHPWSIGGGGAAELKEQLEAIRASFLKEISDELGIASVTGEDDFFVQTQEAVARTKVELSRPLVVGDVLRDWVDHGEEVAFWTYDQHLGAVNSSEIPNLLRRMWAWRAWLSKRKRFGTPMIDRGYHWYEWQELYPNKFKTPLTITYAEVATHNHFVLDRGGKVFKQTAPVIKLPAEIEGEDGSPRPVTEDDHLALLGLLNSSTACFWMKQVCHNKGSTVDQHGARQRTAPFEDFYALNATKLKQFPVASDRPLEVSRELDELAQRLRTISPEAVLARRSEDAKESSSDSDLCGSVPLQDSLATARTTAAETLSEMVRLQEDLDWQCYRLYGLLEESLVGPSPPAPLPAAGRGEPEDVVKPDQRAFETELARKPADSTAISAAGRGEPEVVVKPGQRAFEIVLARKLDAGTAQSTWFERHGTTPITELPEHWPENYRQLVQRRIDAIESNADIALIEQPEYKRRWNTEPWESQVERALQTWLLDRLESYFDFDGRMNDRGEPTAKIDNELISVARLADIAAVDTAFMEVATVYRDDPAFNVARLVEELVTAQSVPLLPILRYKPAGLRKREQWEETWELQRREDAGESVGDIPVPPKYKSSDFISNGGARYWSLRGKLDVPKERWISFPHCPGSDGTLTICWAGYDHLQQALAISAHYQHIKEAIGGDDDPRLIPLLACIAELLPWLRQWHNELDPTYGTSMSDYFDGFLSEEARALNRTIAEIKAWTPPLRKTRRPSRISTK